MTDIRIERRRSSRWVWLIGLIALLLVAVAAIAYLDPFEKEVFGFRDQTEAVVVDSSATEEVGQYEQVEQYNQFVFNDIANADTVDQEMAQKGMMQLSLALGQIMNQSGGQPDSLKAMKRAFDQQLPQDSLAIQPSDRVRSNSNIDQQAFISAARLVSKINQQMDQGVEQAKVDELEQLAASIKTEPTIDAGTDQVRMFFVESAAILTSLIPDHSNTSQLSLKNQ
ncbi:MAG: hypothetical protein ACNS62_17485 [Candidatus Cyclobacteriaceae bacterium M3_2C_046]